MATFTVNSERRVVTPAAHSRVFDKAFFFSIGLIFIVGGIWITEQVLLHLVNQEIAGYKEATTLGLAGVDVAAVNAAEDFAARSALVAEYQDHPSAAEALKTLEQATIPQVRLTEYSYSDNGTTAIAGTTSDYRYVAEQLLRYRKEEALSNMQVTSTDRSEDGKLTFAFSAAPAKKEAKEGGSSVAAPAIPLP